MSSDSLLFDFQPGDGTRYVICISRCASGEVLGYGPEEIFVVSVVNQGISCSLPVRGIVSYSDIQRQIPTANPWTIRAILLLLLELKFPGLELVTPDHLKFTKDWTPPKEARKR